MRSASVHLSEPANLRPLVTQAKGEQQTLCTERTRFWPRRVVRRRSRRSRPTNVLASLRLTHWIEVDIESAAARSHANDESVDQLNPILSTFITRLAAQLGRSDPGVAWESVDAASLPIAGVAGVDDDDPMEISPEPQPGR